MRDIGTSADNQTLALPESSLENMLLTVLTLVIVFFAATTFCLVALIRRATLSDRLDDQTAEFADGRKSPPQQPVAFTPHFADQSAEETEEWPIRLPR